MNYFSRQELQCKCGCETLVFDVAFHQTLNKIRQDFGAPMIITSGYRCPNHPIEADRIAAGKPTGAHGLGVAVDVSVAYGQAYKLVRVAMEHGIERIGVNQKGDGRFIHLDVSKQHASPSMWSY